MSPWMAMEERALERSAVSIQIFSVSLRANARYSHWSSRITRFGTTSKGSADSSAPGPNVSMPM